MPVAIPFIVAAAAAAADVAAVGIAAATLTGVLTAASLGFAAGSIIGNLLFPTHTTSTSTGPRIGDLSVQVSTYGVAIPITFGTDRLSGNVIWALPIKEVATTVSQGGGGKKGGGGGSSIATQTTFSYYGNFAVGLCEGVKAAITRIWANNNLIYDIRTGADAINSPGVDFTFYSGSETQLPDPTMEADKGTGNVPGYRGLCYAVFHDLPLANYGNVLPSLSFEISDAISYSSRVVNLTPGPVLNETTMPTVYGWVDVGINFLKNAGYGLWGISVSSVSGIAVFDLTTMVVYGEALLPDIITGTYDGVADSGFVVGTDQNLYMIANQTPFDDLIFYLVKIDGNTLRQTADLELATTPPFSGSIFNGGMRLTRVFGGDGTMFDCLLVIWILNVGLDPPVVLLSVADVTTMTLLFNSQDILGYFPDIYSNHPNSIMIGRVATGHSDFFMVTDLHLSPNVVSELRRVRVGSDGSVTINLFHTFTPTDFSGTATDISQIQLRGYDVSANLIIMTVVIFDTTTDTYSMAVDDNSSEMIWFTKEMSDATASPVTSSIYGNVNGTILSANTLAAHSVVTDTATGVGTNVDGPSTNPYPTIYWDSATMSYVRFHVYELDRVYLGRHDTLKTTLGSICTQISVKVASNAIDTTTIDDIIVTGFTVSRSDSAANALNAILAGFQVDVVESDYFVKFKLRGSATVADLTETVLVNQTSNEAPEPYKETWQQSAELPSYLNITYEDPALDYQPNTQHDQRVKIPANPTVFSGQTSDLQIPIVMDATTAQQIAQELLYTTWLNRHTFQLRLAPRYLWLDSADPVNLTLRSGYTLRARLGKTDLGADFTSDTLLVSETDGQYTSSLTVTVTNPFPLTIPLAGPSFLILLDTPLLQDGDEVIASSTRGYWGASTFTTGNYQGATLYESADGTSWAKLDAVATATPFGHVETPPPDPTLMWVVELGTSLTVSMANGSSHLVSVTTLDLCNGANAAALIKVNGEVEVFQYRDVTALGTDRFTLTNLLRGRRGTDAMSMGHVAGELFVLLGAGTVHGLAGSISEKNVPLWWGAVTAGAVPNPAYRQSFTFHARDKFPYAPVGVTAVLSGGNINLAWVRRTRVDGALRDSTGVVPLHETVEAYEVDIFTGPGGTFLRTLGAITSPAVSYTAADITADFGSPPATLTVRVYQISNVVGRGFSREDTVTVG